MFAIAWALVLAACAGKDEDTGSLAPPTYTGDDDDACGTDAPVIADLWVENSGMDLYEANQEYVPTVTIWASVTDEDGDLTSFGLTIWYDDEVDGAVEEADGLSGPVTVEGDACEVPAATGGLQIFLAGGIAFETEYEWAAIVTDVGGTDSEVAITTGRTPDAAGEGDP